MTQNHNLSPVSSTNPLPVPLPVSLVILLPVPLPVPLVILLPVRCRSLRW
jgi:hypothetical protein